MVPRVAAGPSGHSLRVHPAFDSRQMAHLISRRPTARRRHPLQRLGRNACDDPPRPGVHTCKILEEARRIGIHGGLQCAARYFFRSIHVVIDRRFCTTVVLIGSTSSAPRSFVTCINIASSTRYRSVPSAIAYQRSCRCRTRPSAPIVDASLQKKSPPGLSVRQQPCSIAWKLSLIHISEPTRQAEISYAVF